MPAAWPAALERLGFDPALAAVAELVARTPPGLDREDRRALALLLLLALVAAQAGHTRLAIRGPGAEETAAWAAELAGPDCDPAALLARPGLALAWGPPAARKPLAHGEEPDGRAWLATLRLAAAEARVALGFRARLGPAPEAALPEGLFNHPVALSAEQAAAVRRAVAAPCTLITGGPGTGKTSIVVAILRAALALGFAPSEIGLAAPTGKAAQRLGESLRSTLARIDEPDAADLALRDQLPEPQTLHRLLAFLPARSAFRHDRGNPLPHRLVVVDESSMVGLELMDGLLQALPEGARLVLLGDAGQLPSVEAGAAFRDLVGALPGTTVRLTHSYRMDAGDPDGRSVLGTAHALREGREADLAAPGLLSVREDPAGLQGRGAELLEADGAALRAFLADWLDRELLGQPGFTAAADRIYRTGGEGWAEGDAAGLEALFRAHERARLLCPLRAGGGLRTTEGLNLHLHGRFRAAAGSGPDRDIGFYAGEPVMVLANDYRHGLFNGDQGVVVMARLADGIHQMAVFRTQDGFRGLPLRPLRGQLDLAYAFTVHKAQGSEFDRIALVLPDHASPLLTREVVYTALTRARKAATILGSRANLAAACRAGTFRNTGLADLLA
jgi:exodeoxyribonuclease V alpha subunit